jgi:hypothetical protein
MCTAAAHVVPYFLLRSGGTAGNGTMFALDPLARVAE